MRTLQWIIFFNICCILASLTGCMNAAVTGAQTVYGRHSLQNSWKDQYITMRADRALHWYSSRYKNANISIYTFNNMVLITGQVPSKDLQNEIVKTIKDIPDVKDIYNETTVEPTASSATHITDAWITAKIKSLFIACNDIDPSQIKVVTENGVVYLMGIVPVDQADAATEIAKSTEGVQKVVKVFSYIHISKTVKN